MFFKDWYIRKIQGRLARHFICNFQRIDNSRFVQGDGFYNNRCFNNSVHKASLEPRTKVILVYCRDCNGFGFLHVINQLSNGMYQDNSLGYDFQNHHYYLIKRVLPDCYPRITEWFNEIRQDWIIQHGSKFWCQVLGIVPTDIF